jgi:hypothetical protein
MLVLLTLGVYSNNISNSLPLQSDYIPLVNIYFLLGIAFSFISLCWFATVEYMKSRANLPRLMSKIAFVLKKIRHFIYFWERVKQNKASQSFKVKKQIDKSLNFNNFIESTPIIIEKVCNKCETCDICLKTKENEKTKADAIKAKLESIKAVNFLVFCFVLFGELISYLAIWIILAS